MKNLYILDSDHLSLHQRGHEMKINFRVKRVLFDQIFKLKSILVSSSKFISFLCLKSVYSPFLKILFVLSQEHFSQS